MWRDARLGQLPACRANVPGRLPARVSEGTLRQAALAHVVTGFAQRRPSLVRIAEKILGSCTVRAAAFGLQISSLQAFRV